MIPILYMNDDFIVINKPIGISVHSQADEPGLVAQLNEMIGSRLWLVHRLDRDTSGVMLLARHAAAAAELSNQFATHQIQKTYLALSDKKPTKKQGLIKGDMQKSRHGNWKLTRHITNPAITRFQSISLTPPQRLFILMPQTGKTHQLRVAMKSLGSPIIGDKRYGGSDAPRLMLHAWRLTLTFQSHEYQFEAPLDHHWPSTLMQTLQHFEENNPTLHSK